MTKRKKGIKEEDSVVLSHRAAVSFSLAPRQMTQGTLRWFHFWL